LDYQFKDLTVLILTLLKSSNENDVMYL